MACVKTGLHRTKALLRDRHRVAEDHDQVVEPESACVPGAACGVTLTGISPETAEAYEASFTPWISPPPLPQTKVIESQETDRYSAARDAARRRARGRARYRIPT